MSKIETILKDRDYVVSDSLIAPFGASAVYEMAFDFSIMRVVLDADEVDVTIYALTAHSQVERYHVALSNAPATVLIATLESVETECEDN